MSAAAPPPPSSAGTKPKRRKRKRRNRFGAFLFFYVLVIGGGTLALYVKDVGWNNAWTPVQEWMDEWRAERDAKRRSDPITTLHRPEGNEVIEMAAADTRPAYQQDPRWEQALALGDAGIARFEAAVKAHYDPNAEGDPFRFRAETTEALAQIDEAVELLNAMKEDLAGNRSAEVAIERELKRYGKSLDSLGNKANRR